jgi:hypothetical protein
MQTQMLKNQDAGSFLPKNLAVSREPRYICAMEAYTQSDCFQTQLTREIFFMRNHPETFTKL